MALSMVVLMGRTEDVATWVGKLVGQAGGLRVGNGFDDGMDVSEQSLLADQCISLSLSPGLRPSLCLVVL